MELSLDESDDVLKFLTRLVPENHDLQVRYKWDAGDVAIWDNRCTFHAATYACLVMVGCQETNISIDPTTRRSGRVCGL